MNDLTGPGLKLTKNTNNAASMTTCSCTKKSAEVFPPHNCHSHILMINSRTSIVVIVQTDQLSPGYMGAVLNTILGHTEVDTDRTIVALSQIVAGFAALRV